MSDVQLYSNKSCPFAQRTRMVLIEKDIDFELTEVDLGEKPEWYKEVSPYGKVPLIMHSGQRIYESVIINEYLDEVFPSPPMMPSDPAMKAQARIWFHYCENYLLGATFKIFMLRKEPEKQKEAIAKLMDVLRFIDKEGFRKLSDGPFWLGEKVSLLDLHYSPFLERLAGYKKMWGVEIPEDCTRVHGWLKAMKSVKSLKETGRSEEAHYQGLLQRVEDSDKSAAAA